MRSQPGQLHRLSAVLVIAGMVLGLSARSASAAGPAGNVVIRGTVAGLAGNEIAGVRVYAVHLDTKQVFTSAPSGPRGEYQITGLPFGYYDLAVETPEGLYLANRVINAPAGERVEISLLLGPPQPEDTEWWSAEPDRRIPGLDRVPDGVARIVEGKPSAVRPAGPAPAPGTAAPTAAAASQGRGGLLLPGLLALGIVGLALVLDDDDDDEALQATTFAPQP